MFHKGYIQTKEHIEKRRKKLIGKSVPINIRLKISKKLTGRHLSAKHKINIGNASRIALNKPEVRKKISDMALKQWSNPKIRKQMIVAKKRAWANPEIYSKMVNAQIKRFSNPIEREKQRNAIKKIWENRTPEMRRKLGEKSSISNKRFWINLNPEDRKSRIANVLKASHIKPNRAELLLNNILKSLFPNEYKYVGNGEFILGGKCPDFVNVNGQKKIIELYGNYWHKNHNPQNRIDLFKKYGYNTLIIWEHELKGIEPLKNKLKKFNMMGVGT